MSEEMPDWMKNAKRIVITIKDLEGKLSKYARSFESGEETLILGVDGVRYLRDYLRETGAAKPFSCDLMRVVPEDVVVEYEAYKGDMSYVGIRKGGVVCLHDNVDSEDLPWEPSKASCGLKDVEPISRNKIKAKCQYGEAVLELIVENTLNKDS